MWGALCAGVQEVQGRPNLSPRAGLRTLQRPTGATNAQQQHWQQCQQQEAAAAKVKAATARSMPGRSRRWKRWTALASGSEARCARVENCRSDFGTAIWHAQLLVPTELFSLKLLSGKENLSCPMLRGKEERNGDSLSPQDSVSARQNLPKC